MKNPQPFLPVLLAVLALTSPLCLAAGQDMQNDSSLVAVGSVPEETGEQAEPVSQPPMQFAELGGADASGGNFVGDELLDDYESRGTTKLTSAEIVSTLQPLTERLNKMLPSFSKYLLEGAAKTDWILDTKPLRQDGACLNQTSISVKAVIRACQSKVTVRIDQRFLEENAKVKPGLYVHELLVYHALRSGGKISEDGLRMASRAIRDPNISANELKQTLARAGFGNFLTAAETAAAKAAHIRAMAIERKNCRQADRMFKMNHEKYGLPYTPIDCSILK